MTSSARGALLMALHQAEKHTPECILAKLAEEGWVMVPREMILQAGIKLSLSEFRSDHVFADAMLAAINGEEK